MIELAKQLQVAVRSSAVSDQDLSTVPEKLAAPLVQGNSGPVHFSLWISLVGRISQGARELPCTREAEA